VTADAKALSGRADTAPRRGQATAQECELTARRRRPRRLPGSRSGDPAGGDEMLALDERQEAAATRGLLHCGSA
jgi:hypothetical protein